MFYESHKKQGLRIPGGVHDYWNYALLFIHVRYILQEIVITKLCVYVTCCSI